MTPKEIAKLFDLWALLLELRGENPFRVRAFSRAAATLNRYKEDSETLLEEIQAKKIKGIGSQLLAFTQEAYATGSIADFEQLRSEFSEELLELFAIPGLGPKKIKALRAALGIDSVAQLKDQALAGTIASIHGFGEKTQSQLLSAVLEFESNRGILLLSEAMSMSKQLASRFKKSFPRSEIREAGPLRRRCETMKVLDFVCLGVCAKEVSDFLKEISLIDISQHHHESKVSACTKNGTVVNIYLTKDKSEATTRLFLVTGSTAHLDGLFTGGEDREKFLDALPKPLEEKSLYHAFGLSYIPPEYRETCVSLGPAQAAFAKGQQDVPLLCSSDICGILHTHSTYSDGALGVKELAEQAIGLGYSFLGISDHSQSAAYAGGLSIDSVKRQHEEIDRLNEVLAPFRLFKGIESDILRDGSLDYPESVLESFDYVIISIHSGFSMSEEEMTRRIVRALAHPLSSILGHPTGRLLKKRKPYAVCLPKVLEAAAETKTAVEINSNPWRLDLDAEHAAEAARLGIQIPISPDAHSQEGFSHVEYGVCIARKAGLRAENILTTKTTAQLLEYFNAQRKFKSKSP